MDSTKLPDEPIDSGLRQVDVGIREQGHEIVGVGAHPGVLKVDDVQLAVVTMRLRL